MSRVQIAPIDAVPFDLIDRAQAVASAAGRCAGKPFAEASRRSPSRIAGSSPVMACTISGGKRMARSHQSIQAGEQVDVELVRLFALAVHNLDVPGAVGGPHNLNSLA